MAYRLKPQETVARGLRRLAKKQLRAARDELRKSSPPADAAIHEARKSLKKVRAIRDLIEADAGAGVKRDKKALRRVSRKLSDVRDASAMPEVLKKLRQRNPQLLDEHTLARLRRRLISRKQESMEGARRNGVWKDIDRDLRALRRRVNDWRPTHRRFGALASGLRRTLRRGRKALAHAKKRRRAGDFHEWRKQVKALWYELRLIAACSPEIGRDVTALHRAETALGDDHNIAVLCRRLWQDASLNERERLQRAADRLQRALRRKAIADTAQIYRRSAGEYVRRVKRVWLAWRRHHDAHATKARRDVA
jgi:CHAD domain-containing protein